QAFVAADDLVLGRLVGARRRLGEGRRGKRERGGQHGRARERGAERHSPPPVLFSLDGRRRRGLSPKEAGSACFAAEIRGAAAGLASAAASGEAQASAFSKRASIRPQARSACCS